MLGTMFLSMFMMVTVQKKFHGVFAMYSKQNSNTGFTGAQIAQQILDKNGINYITVVKGTRPGQDHFNPMKKVIMLSPQNYDSTSIAAVAVAAHEVGHAIQ
jgi:Zn-dependent membrane protease YugP